MVVRVSEFYNKINNLKIFETSQFENVSRICRCRSRDYAGRFFCPRCGSSVFARSADEIEVHLGSLDAPNQLMPTYESWITRREFWLPPFPLTRQYNRDRDATSRLEE
jgi:hypothetical protein